MGERDATVDQRERRTAVARVCLCACRIDLDLVSRCGIDDDKSVIDGADHLLAVGDRDLGQHRDRAAIERRRAHDPGRRRVHNLDQPDLLVADDSIVDDESRDDLCSARDRERANVMLQ